MVLHMVEKAVGYRPIETTILERQIENITTAQPHGLGVETMYVQHRF
jgi:hypothetical protein